MRRFDKQSRGMLLRSSWRAHEYRAGGRGWVTPSCWSTRLSSTRPPRLDGTSLRLLPAAAPRIPAQAHSAALHAHPRRPPDVVASRVRRRELCSLWTSGDGSLVGRGGARAVCRVEGYRVRSRS